MNNDRKFQKKVLSSCYSAGESTAENLESKFSEKSYTDDQILLKTFRDQIIHLQRKTHQLSFVLSEVDDILKCAVSSSVSRSG